MLAAAVLAQVGEQRIHPREVREQSYHAPLALVAHESGGAQHIEMGRQRRGRDRERFAQRADGDPGSSGLYQLTEGLESMYLAEGAQGGEGGL